jgi:hypothetical protein
MAGGPVFPYAAHPYANSVTFEEILSAVKGGRKARRALWAARSGYMDGWDGLAVELVQPPPLPDGRPFMPQLVIQDEDGILRPFAGANWDLLAGDWELL